jgi:uncharacterized membrane protein
LVKGTFRVKNLIAFVLIAAYALLGGCGGEEESAADASESPAQAVPTEDTTGAAASPEIHTPDAQGEVLRGYLIFVSERRSFTACGTNESSWVVDASGSEMSDVYKKLALNPGDPVFIEVFGLIEPAPVEGFGADYANQVTVLELRRAAVEGPGCNEDLRSVEFRARGNEPFWAVDIAGSGIIFSDFGRSEKLMFPYVAPGGSAETTKYTSTIKGTNSHRITIVVKKKPCYDSMSGAYFSYVAIVEMDGRKYDGCAMEGW